ncbi:Rot1 protein [Martiniozyma asiatica (nom. inval.)]|nr:Rot1 protein [Martiniozyma asiatica]
MRFDTILGPLQLALLWGSVAADDTSDSSIVGTWSSKSNSVFTGPEFYDPVDELLIEPSLPGISYSFTSDGFFEEALYQVTPNPKNHSCATAVLIYQHGTYEQLDNGTLILTPFEIDGRQLLSQPCDDNGISTYTRYHQAEVFKGANVYVDPYHGRWRLDLIKSTGAYMQPLYLAYRPPQMLPTSTMNPVATGDGSTLKKRSLTEKVKRGLQNKYKTNAVKKSIDHEFWWWVSASMMGVGGVMFFFG